MGLFMEQIKVFQDVVSIRKSCKSTNHLDCNNNTCPLKAKGTLDITVCELVTSHILAKPECVEIVCSCPSEDDPLGIKDFFDYCQKGFIRPTARQMEHMQRQASRCKDCPANIRYPMQHAKLNITINPHLCTTLRSTVLTIRNAAGGRSCSLGLLKTKTTMEPKKKTRSRRLTK